MIIEHSRGVGVALAALLSIATVAMAEGCSNAHPATPRPATGGTAGRGSGGSGGSAGTPEGGTGGLDSGPDVTTGGTAGSAGSDGGLDASNDAPADAYDPRVRAVAIDNYVTESGKVQQAVDLSRYEIAALVPDADAGAGAFRQFLPTITGAGTFEIMVPQGPYYLRYFRNDAIPIYVHTSAHSLDLAIARSGRPDTQPASAGTMLAFNVTGLNAWQASDDISLYAPNAGVSVFSLQTAAASGLPVAGNTALTALTVDYASVASPRALIDETKGDRASIIQLVTRTLPDSDTYTSATKAFLLPAFSLVNGQTTTINGSFVDVAQGSMISVDWKVTQFLGLGAAIPSTTRGLTSFAVYGELAPDEGFYANRPTLLEYASLRTTDVAVSLQFGNPLTPAYSLIAAAHQNFRRSYALDGTTPTVIVAAVNAAWPASESVAARPVVGPPSELRINGQAADGNLTGVGQNPTISWNPPSLGSANQYVVRILRLYTSAGATQRDTAGLLLTTSTSVVLPPGLMRAGERYVLHITAISEAGIDHETKPFKSMYPRGAGEALSGILAP